MLPAPAMGFRSGPQIFGIEATEAIVWTECNTVDSLPVSRPAPSPEHPQGLCLDKGYDYPEVRRTVDEFGFTAHIRSRGEEAKAIKREAGKARRWVVHSWLKYRTGSCCRR